MISIILVPISKSPLISLILKQFLENTSCIFYTYLGFLHSTGSIVVEESMRHSRVNNHFDIFLEKSDENLINEKIRKINEFDDITKRIMRPKDIYR